MVANKTNGENKVRPSFIQQSENQYFNSQMIQTTLKSIFMTKSNKNFTSTFDKSKLESNSLTASSENFLSSVDYSDICKTDCPLTSNGTWAHIPLDWLPMMACIFNLVDEAIQTKDIKILHKIQESQKHFYEKMSFTFPSTALKKEKTLKHNILNNAEKCANKIMSFGKSNDKVPLMNNENPCFVKNDICDSVNWFIPNSVGRRAYLEEDRVKTFEELLDILAQLPVATRIILSQVGPSTSNHTGVAMDDDVSDSLTVMSLIPAQGPETRKVDFHDLLGDSTDSAKKNEVEDEYDDSNYQEFNIKYVEPEKPMLTAEHSGEQISDIRDEVVVQVVYPDERSMIRATTTATDMCMHSSDTLTSAVFEEKFKLRRLKTPLRSMEDLNDVSKSNVIKKEKVMLLSSKLKTLQVNRKPKQLISNKIRNNREYISEKRISKTEVEKRISKRVKKKKETPSVSKTTFHKKTNKIVPHVKRTKQNVCIKKKNEKHNVNKPQIIHKNDYPKLFSRTFTVPDQIRKRIRCPNKEKGDSVLQQIKLQMKTKENSLNIINKNKNVKEIKKENVVFKSNIIARKPSSKTMQSYQEMKIQSYIKRQTSKIKKETIFCAKSNNTYLKKENNLLLEFSDEKKNNLLSKKYKYFHLYHPKIVDSKSKFEPEIKRNVNIIKENLSFLQNVYHNIE